jgi:hypothetical protein
MQATALNLQTGIHQLDVNFSFQTNGASAPTVIRDGKSAIVATAVRTSAGLFTVTLSVLLGKMVAGVATVESVDDTPTDINLQCRYIQASKQIKIYALTGAVLTDLEAGARINFKGSFWMRQDVQEA